MQAYLLHLRCALLDSFLAVNRKIILTKSGGGGCTASVVLVVSHSLCPIVKLNVSTRDDASAARGIVSKHALGPCSTRLVGW